MVENVHWVMAVQSCITTIRHRAYHFRDISKNETQTKVTTKPEMAPRSTCGLKCSLSDVGSRLYYNL